MSQLVSISDPSAISRNNRAQNYAYAGMAAGAAAMAIPTYLATKAMAGLSIKSLLAAGSSLVAGKSAISFTAFVISVSSGAIVLLVAAVALCFFKKIAKLKTLNEHYDYLKELICNQQTRWFKFSLLCGVSAKATNLSSLSTVNLLSSINETPQNKLMLNSLVGYDIKFTREQLASIKKRAQGSKQGQLQVLSKRRRDNYNNVKAKKEGPAQLNLVLITQTNDSIRRLQQALRANGAIIRTEDSEISIPRLQSLPKDEREKKEAMKRHDRGMEFDPASAANDKLAAASATVVHSQAAAPVARPARSNGSGTFVPDETVAALTAATQKLTEANGLGTGTAVYTQSSHTSYSSDNNLTLAARMIEVS